MAKELSCGVHFTRGILLILNILFVIVGLALIGIGIYIKVSNNFTSILNQFVNVQGFEAQSLGFLAFVMIGGGVFTLLIALFGCMGTLWNSRCCLYAYAIILLILMIVEFVALIMAFVYKSKLTAVYETALFTVLEDALKSNNSGVLTTFRDLEKNMKCCGVHGLSDYIEYNNFTELSDGCKEHPTVGCSQAIIDFLNTNLPKIGITLGCVLAVELFGLIAAIALAVALKHAPDDTYSSNPREVIGNVVPGRRHNYYA